jgi:hypothetical protein
MNSKLLTVITFLIFLLTTAANAQSKKSHKDADKQTQQWRYELEAAGAGSAGTYQVKVWSYSKDVKTAIEQAKKNAIHGCIFRGFAANGRIQQQGPLTTNPNLESEKEDFFKAFFADGGKYLKYVSISNQGTIAPGDAIKIGKEYKVGVVVSVMKDELRKDLENAGIIKSMSSGF